MYRGMVVLSLLVWAGSAVAQHQVHNASGRGTPRVNPQRNVQAIPKLDCSKLTAGEPWMIAYCREVDFSLQRHLSASFGRPLPSRTVIEVPALGTPEAKASGVSCSEGRVIARIGNGWVQALDRERNYLRCRPTVELPAISIGR